MTAQYQAKISVINELLRKRMAVTPIRDDSFTRLNDALENFAAYLIGETDFKTFNPNPDILSEGAKFANSPVFICGSFKGGTTLLTQLLDNHPDLLVMPGDSRFVTFLNRWNRDQFSEIATHWIHRMINPCGTEPFWFLGPEENTFKLFLQYTYYFLNNSQYSIFVCIIMSVYAVNSTLSSLDKKKYWVEKTPQNELNVEILSELFPRAKFIHILRDPLNNVAALKKLSEMGEYPITPAQYAQSIKLLFRAAIHNQKTLGKEKYHILTYENLTSNSENTLRDICNFLEIPFDEILLKPTENGRPAMSNSMFKESRVKGVILDQSRSKRYKNLLSQAEIQEIISILYSETVALGYPWNTAEFQYYRVTGLLKQKITALVNVGKRLLEKVVIRRARDDKHD